MEINDVRRVREIIHETPTSELFIVSLFFLPILLGAWLIIFQVLNIDSTWQLKLSGILLVLYIIAIIVMKRWDPPDAKLKRARVHISGKLEKRRGNRASFEAIREELNNENYTNEFLMELIEKSPGIFRFVQVKRNGEYKPGITLFEPTEDNN